MKVDLGAVILGGLEWLDRLVEHGFAILLACAAICLTAIVWKFAGADVWWYVKALAASVAVVMVAGAGGFVVWLIGRRFLR